MKTATDSVIASVDILNSWKEIAGYLNRGVRTVQRWEADLGMPVRRPRGRGRSAVIAIRSELDRWIRSCPLEEQLNDITFSPAGSMLPVLDELRTSTIELHRMRSQINASRDQLSVALNELAASIQKMARTSRGGAGLGSALAAPRESSTAA